MPLSFNQKIPVLTEFEQVADWSIYKPLPSNWQIGIADVVNSTKAIVSGRYKEVNFAGAATISALSNALGGKMPLFAFGIYLTKQDTSITEIEIPSSVIFLTLLIFILSNVNQHLWVLSNISFIILFLVIMNTVIPRIKGNLHKALSYTGQISMALFLVNGFLRFPMLRWAIAKDNWLVTIALCLVFLGISYVVAITVILLEKLFTQRINAYRNKHSHVT